MQISETRAFPLVGGRLAGAWPHQGAVPAGPGWGRGLCK